MKRKSLLGKSLSADVKNLKTFELYKFVLMKNRSAEDELIRRHKDKFPDHFIHQNEEYRQSPSYREDLHMMYIHLT